jgi:hypothetical protein
MTGLRALPQPMRRYGLLVVGLGLALVLAVLAAWRAPTLNAKPAFPTPKYSGAQALAQIYGVRITLVGLTADGAMLDFRFQILDSDKAYTLLADPNRVPLLLSERTKKLAHIINVMQPRHDMKVGAIYSLLFYNTQGATAQGDQVTAILGDVKVEHLAVQ